MKKTILFILVSFAINSFGQKMISRTGEIKFDATISGAIDNVSAVDNTATAILEKSSGDFVVQSMVKSFKFKLPLMQEHFNENYMESDKYPKTTFKGKIVKYDQKSGVYDVEGDLTIHGVTNKVKTKMNVATTDAKVTVSGSFTVSLKNYKLEVPALAKKTLSETAKISIKIDLTKK
jgi:polyisoprenoid-binding protein YceI